MNQSNLKINIITLIYFYSLLSIIKTTCGQSCISCSTSLNCLQCTSNIYMAIATTPIKGCLPCRPGCKTCTSEYSQCTSCASTYYMNNILLACMPCMVQYCESCIQSMPDVCNTCMSGYYLISASGTCENCGLYPNAATCRQNMILSCQPGFYVAGGQKCMSCASNCLRCMSSTFCTTCLDGYFGSSCTSCNPTCLTCIKTTACLTCKPGTFLNSSSLCSPCIFSNNPNCISCDNTGKCNKCQPYYFLDSNKICIAVTQQQLILGCIQYSTLFNGSSMVSICKACELGYFLSGSGLSCIQCSLLCANCTGIYSTSTCLLCQPDIAISLSLGFCTVAANSFVKNNYENKYLSQWNYPNNFTDFGSVLTLINQNCPSWKLSTQSRVQIGVINGYNISFRIKITFSVNNLVNLSKFYLTLNFNNITIAQVPLEKNQTIQKSSLCSQPLINNNLNYQFTQIITGTLPDSILINQLAPILNLPNNSNYFQLVTITSDFYLKITQIVVSYNSCHQSCALCLSDIQCGLCKKSQMFLQQGQCVNLCSDFYYQFQNTCVKSCPIGTFQNAYTKFWICSSCALQCSRCVSIISCSACNYGYFLFGQKCVSKCPDQYFPNPTSSHCQPCSPPCLTCNSSSICLSCSYNFLHNNSCIPSTNCPQTYYPNIAQMSCTKCQYPCLTCKYSNFCLQCLTDSGYLFKGKCYPACPIGYFINMSQKRCDQCQSDCYECSNTTNYCIKCIKCINSFLLNGKCLDSCPNGLYQNYTAMTCDVCSFPCLTCRFNSNICKTCIKGYILHQQKNVCILESTCQAMVGSYVNSKTFNVNSTTITNVKYCIACPQQCFLCLSSTKCQTCNPPYFLINQTCLLSCPFGYYNNQRSQICGLCSPNCSTCFHEQYFCTSCPINMKLNYLNRCEYRCLYKNQLLLSCQECMQPCYECFSNITMCVSCVQGYFLHVGKHECLLKCYEGFYEQLISRTCARCSQLCLTCTNYSTQCTSCPNLLYLFIHNSVERSGICVKVCPSTYFPSIFSTVYHVCKLCKQPCLQCTINETNCISCISGILYHNQCIFQCPSGKYFQLTNNTCMQCPEKCLTCFGKTNFQCYSCKIGSYYMEQISSCLLLCPNRYISISFGNDGSRCTACQFPCLECVNTTKTCTSCWSNQNITNDLYLLYKNTCVKNCPDKSFQLNNSCILCQQPCLQCLSLTICLTCIPSKYFLNNECLSQCPVSYFPNAQTQSCINCQYPCKTCINQTHCLTCIDGILIGNSCVFSTECQAGKYLSYVHSNGVCQDCSSQCLLCQQNKDRCLLCVNSSLVLFDHQCLKLCAIGYYQVVQVLNLGLIGFKQTHMKTCKVCPFQCVECISQTKCINCSRGYKNLQGRCLHQCPSSYYSSLINISSMIIQCKKCSSQCRTCVNSAQNCLSCQVGFYLYLFKCINECQNGTYAYFQSYSTNILNNTGDNLIEKTGGICRSCIFPCRLCQNSQVCISCFAGYYIYRGLCVQNCKKPHVILELKDNYTCIDTCPSSHKFVLDYDNIFKCSAMCQYPYVLSSDGNHCLKVCPNNQYINQNLQCQNISTANKSQIQITAINLVTFIDSKYKIKLLISFNKSIIYQQFQPYIQEMLEVGIYSDYLYKNDNLSSIKNYVSSRILTVQQYSQQTYKPVQYMVSKLNPNYFLFQLNPTSFSFISIQTPSNQFSNFQTTNYLTLAFKNNSNLLIRNKISTIPLQSSFYISQLPIFQIYPNSSEDKTYFRVFGQVYVVFLLILAGILFYLNWYAKIYQALHFCQIVFLFSVLQIHYPPNLWLFLQGFKDSHFYFIGNWFISNENITKVTKTFPKIESIFVDCNFIRICGHVFCFSFIFLFFIFILFTLKQIQKIQDKIPHYLNFLIKLSKVAQNKLKLIKWSHTCDFILTITIISFFGFFMQMHDYNTDYLLQILGILFSYFVIVGLAVYFIYTGYRMHKITQMSDQMSQKLYQKKYMQMRKIFPTVDIASYQKQLYLRYIKVIRIVVIGSLIGIFSSTPMLCTGSIIVIMMASAGFFILLKPYSNYLQNILLGCADMGVSMALFFISLISFQSNDLIISTDNTQYLTIKWRLGWAAIIMIIISAFLLMAQLLVNFVKGNITHLKLSAEDPKQIPAPLLNRPPRVIEVTPKKQLNAWEIDGEQPYSTTIGLQYQNKHQ